MGLLIFNWRGLAMVVLALVSGVSVGDALGWVGEGPPMMVAGPLAFAFDMAWRARFARPERRWWLLPSHGGALFFVPVWCFGALWLVLGASYALRA